jgi:hypothetical protein
MKRRSSRRITASCPSSRCPPRASDRSVAPGIRVAACLANRYGASGSSFAAMRSVGTLSSPNGKAVRPCWRRSRQLTGFPLRFVLAAFNRRSILYRSLIANPGRAFYLDPDCADPQARIGYGYVTNRIGTDLQGDPRDIPLQGAIPTIAVTTTSAGHRPGCAARTRCAPLPAQRNGRRS